MERLRISSISISSVLVCVSLWMLLSVSNCSTVGGRDIPREDDAPGPAIEFGFTRSNKDDDIAGTAKDSRDIATSTEDKNHPHMMTGSTGSDRDTYRRVTLPDSDDGSDASTAQTDDRKDDDGVGYKRNMVTKHDHVTLTGRTQPPHSGSVIDLFVRRTEGNNFASSQQSRSSPLPAASSLSSSSAGEVSQELKQEEYLVTPEAPGLATNTMMSIQAMVLNLQSKLAASEANQAGTRSILNVIEEKQLSQEQDLALLKNEISQVRKDQNKDRAAISALKTLVSDNSWGVADLKSEQDQQRLDLTSYKRHQEVQNDTLQLVDDRFLANQNRHHKHDDSIWRLQSDIIYLKKQAEQDRTSLKQLKVLLSHQRSSPQTTWGRADKNSVTGTTSFTTSTFSKPIHSNRIVPSPFPPEESSLNGNAGAGTNQLDRLASGLEEKYNVIQDNMQELTRKESQLKKNMDTFSNQFVQYNSELSKVYAMFYNLSLHISTLENKLLQQQKRRFESDVSELQQSFLNFTNQIFHLEQWHSTNKAFFNTSSQNQNEIVQMANIVENHRNRIKSLENILLDHKLANTRNQDLINVQMNNLNDTVHTFYRSFSDHNSKASNVFSDVDEKLMEFNTRIKNNDERLLRVEVKVLNASLTACQKSNGDLLQDMKLSDFSGDLGQVDNKVAEHGIEIERMDRGVGRLYEDMGKQAKLMDEVLKQVTDIMTLVPQIDLLQQEVQNFVLHLPRDCSEVMATQVNSHSGPYLIKPDRSHSSSRTHCEFDGLDAWTLVQQRQDGSQSFARSWDEYKYGFGETDSEFWIGNENLHFLTSQEDYVLHIDMWDLHNRYWYADYRVFTVDDETSNYMLHVDGYSGNATDAMKYSNYMPFSTMDRDNDVSSTHCAKFYTAGWWYKHCHYSNLNGRYTVGVVWFNHDFDEWVQMRRTVMKLRLLRQADRQHNSSETTDESSEQDSSA